ncbi:MAG: hypothetical protein IKX40_00275 [Thermoguttaceae bacterium]|nr:hypothetical protein [Thermoguttaceae bacterium]
MQKVDYIFAIFANLTKIFENFSKKLLLGACKNSKNGLQYNQLKGNLVRQKQIRLKCVDESPKVSRAFNVGVKKSLLYIYRQRKFLIL